MEYSTSSSDIAEYLSLMHYKCSSQAVKRCLNVADYYILD